MWFGLFTSSSSNKPGFSDPGVSRSQWLQVGCLDFSWAVVSEWHCLCSGHAVFPEAVINGGCLVYLLCSRPRAALKTISLSSVLKWTKPGPSQVKLTLHWRWLAHCTKIGVSKRPIRGVWNAALLIEKLESIKRPSWNIAALPTAQASTYAPTHTRTHTANTTDLDFLFVNCIVSDNDAYQASDISALIHEGYVVEVTGWLAGGFGDESRRPWGRL